MLGLHLKALEDLCVNGPSSRALPLLVLAGCDSPLFEGALERRVKGRDAINIPLKDIYSMYSRTNISQVVDKILEVFQPNAVVLRCGADSLSGDKIRLLKSHACALGTEDTIDPNLPWNEYFEWFGPRYRLKVAASNMEDMNVEDGSLEQVWINALEHLRKLNCAPSAGMRDVPKENLRPRRRRKQRMSLLTGQYFDVAHNHQSRRKFFQSRVVFDDTWQRVKLVQGLGLGFGCCVLERYGEQGPASVSSYATTSSSARWFRENKIRTGPARREHVKSPGAPADRAQPQASSPGKGCLYECNRSSKPVVVAESARRVS
ncbi:hypothetical protein EDD18DRAFT_1328210 [Armillaria luteobubalina]|uniref:Uncharacterized protein n=1 Tax=Armillaria luteobubalina TaxID=153913 RepID=A0AA39UXZ8_9AGAR|nr:hypothetical protein EDD18DRAFT_1328210 [Armillaria luteobubalina]